MKGNVYKRRRRVELILDPFELAYMEGHLDSCVLMANAGYCLHRKTQLFTDDLKVLQSGSGSTHSPASNQVSLALANPENVPRNYRNILDWMIEQARSPRSLNNEAIFVIRACLRCRLVDGVDSLPLPSSVKRSILLIHILT